MSSAECFANLSSTFLLNINFWFQVPFECFVFQNRRYLCASWQNFAFSTPSTRRLKTLHPSPFAIVVFIISISGVNLVAVTHTLNPFKIDPGHSFTLGGFDLASLPPFRYHLTKLRVYETHKPHYVHNTTSEYLLHIHAVIALERAA